MLDGGGWGHGQIATVVTSQITELACDDLENVAGHGRGTSGAGIGGRPCAGRGPRGTNRLSINANKQYASILLGKKSGPRTQERTVLVAVRASRGWLGVQVGETAYRVRCSDSRRPVRQVTSVH